MPEKKARQRCSFPATNFDDDDEDREGGRDLAVERYDADGYWSSDCAQDAVHGLWQLSCDCSEFCRFEALDDVLHY